MMNLYILVVITFGSSLEMVFAQDLPLVVNYDPSHVYEYSSTYSLRVNGQEVFVTEYQF
jgi:hypothetical protein